jgi:hypothetical protein
MAVMAVQRLQWWHCRQSGDENGAADVLMVNSVIN